MPEPPSFIEPMLCKLVASAPASAGWLHEAKFDGYRLQARIWRGEVRLRTRSGLDWTQKFPALTQDLKACGSGILDGELCAIDAAGKPDFAALLLALSARRTNEVIYKILWSLERREASCP